MQNNDQGHSSRSFRELSLEEIYLISEALSNTNAQVKITVQPASSFRFRYEKGSPNVVIRGSEENKHLTIEILNFEGKAVVRVSCVTADEPYRLHPNELKNIDKPDNTGVYIFEYLVTSDSKAYEIKNLGLVYVKLEDIEDSLTRRKNLGVDPFKSGFSHIGIGKKGYKSKTKKIDRDSFRLCFEVFFPYDQKEPLSPIVSKVIKNKKPLSEPKIIKQNPCSAYVTGGAEIVLMCNKVEKDYEVIFYLEDEIMGRVWEAKATEILVHQSSCIVLTVPPFRDVTIKENITVQIQIRKPGDKTRSNSVPFEYICIPEGIKALKKQVSDLLKLSEGAVATTSNNVPVTSPVSIPQMANNSTAMQKDVSPILSEYENTDVNMSVESAMSLEQCLEKMKSGGMLSDKELAEYLEYLEFVKNAERDGRA